jgi:transposase-like protein
MVDGYSNERTIQSSTTEKHCPSCAALARFTTSLLDVKRGKTVRLYRCDSCQKEIWDE